MIRKEFYRTRKDGVRLYRTYSDAGLKIQKIGTKEYYDEAIDVGGTSYLYKETTIPTNKGGVDNGTGAAEDEN